MVAVACQQTWVEIVHAHDTVCSAAVEEFQNGTYLKNMPHRNINSRTGHCALNYMKFRSKLWFGSVKKVGERLHHC